MASAEASICMLFFVQHGRVAMDDSVDQIATSLKASIIQSAGMTHNHPTRELAIMQIFRVSVIIMQVNHACSS